MRYALNRVSHENELRQAERALQSTVVRKYMRDDKVFLSAEGCGLPDLLLKLASAVQGQGSNDFRRISRTIARLHVSARRAEIPANINCCCYDCCGSLNVDMLVVWAVVDVFVSQLSVPPQVAQTVGPQKHQQRPTKTAAHSMLTW